MLRRIYFNPKGGRPGILSPKGVDIDHKEFPAGVSCHHCRSLHVTICNAGSNAQGTQCLPPQNTTLRHQHSRAL